MIQRLLYFLRRWKWLNPLQFSLSYRRLTLTELTWMKYLPTRILLLTVVAFGAVQQGRAQQSELDSLFAKGDSTAVIDSLLKDFDLYLDSLTKPKSFFSVS